MKSIITIGLILMSTLSFAQKKHWTNGLGEKTKKNIATKYYTVTKNKPNKNYIVKTYNKATTNLIESTSYLTKKKLIKEGDYVSYYENKNIMDKGTYLNNLKEGTWTTYTNDSKLQSIINYSKDKKDGLYEFHSLNGYSKGFYSLNKKVKEWAFYNKEGVLYQKINYKNDLQDGELTTFYPNGNIKEVLLYKQGKFKKILKRLDINGNEIKEELEEDSTLYTIVEEQPEFPGGARAMMKFLAESTKYPRQAIENGIQGRVYISFVVEKDGALSEVQNAAPKRRVHKTLEKEAIRVVKSMPKWKPGRQRGKAVRVKYTVPINFKIR